MKWLYCAAIKLPPDTKRLEADVKFNGHHWRPISAWTPSSQEAYEVTQERKGSEVVPMASEPQTLSKREGWVHTAQHDS